jgi:hypothetical protein
VKDAIVVPGVVWKRPRDDLSAAGVCGCLTAAIVY